MGAETARETVSAGLPDFIRAREDGVWADLSRLNSGATFAEAVDRLFTMGTYFTGLDYPVFLKLLYACEPAILQEEIAGLSDAGKTPMWRFAQGLARMDEQRIRLYRGLRTGGGEASYLFEPLSEEITVEDEGGGTHVEHCPLQLNLDEFVCQLWVKGVRCGIDVAAVAQAIGGGRPGQIVVARSIAPVPGTDAEAQEVHQGLHRDNRPRLLDDGRVDLSAFGNRFPQLKRGACLMRKQPLVLGQPGRDLSGRPLPPPLPRDFDLGTLVGPGTALERRPDGDVIVAAQDGFLNIDADTNQLSVTEKIIHKEGVSLRTTGDLALTGEHYEEHGEILEKRVVEGRNITVLADVHGRLVSSGGEIHVGARLVGGSAFNAAGGVTVDGLVSGAQIQAPAGDIRLARVEGSVLLGRRVKAAHAVNCVIVADEVELELAEACSIEARRMVVGRTGVHARQPCVLLLRVPDLAPFEANQVAHGQQRDVLKQRAAELEAAVAAQLAEPEFAHFLKIFGQIRRHELEVPKEREAAWRQVTQRWQPVLQRLTHDRDALAQAQRGVTALEEVMKQAREDIMVRRATVRCELQMPDAELELRCVRDEGDGLLALSAQEARALLHGHQSLGEPVPVPSCGPFSWGLPPLPDVAV